MVTLVLPEQKRDVSQLLRKAAISVEPVAVTATSPEVVELVGQVAPYVKPVPVAETPRGTSQGANAQRKRAARQGGADESGQRASAGSGRARRGRGNAGQGSADAAPRRSEGTGAAHRGQGGSHRSGGSGASRSGGSGAARSGGRSGGLRVGDVVHSRAPRTNRRAQG